MCWWGTTWSSASAPRRAVWTRFSARRRPRSGCKACLQTALVGNNVFVHPVGAGQAVYVGEAVIASVSQTEAHPRTTPPPRRWPKCGETISPARSPAR